MEKSIARVVSVLFHPLFITTLGMLIIFNSGTSLSVLQTEVKRIAVIISVLFTIVFPALMISLLYLTKSISTINLANQRERMLPLALTIILYLFTFFVMKGIPQLSRGHIVYIFCAPAALFVAMIINNYIKLSIHLLSLGGLLGLILVLILFYGAQIDLYFILTVLAAGLSGTSRLLLKANTMTELLLGFTTGFAVSTGILLIFIL